MAEGKFISVGMILEKYARMIVDGLKSNLTANDSIASYKLLQSVQANVTIYGSVYTMEIRMEDYWKYVEFGREPGKFPPIEPIIKWTVQKGFSMEAVAQSFRDNAAKNRRLKGVKQRSFDNIRKKPKKLNRERVRKQLAFLIARKIKNKGIEPTGFASDVLGGSFIHEGIAKGGIWDKLTAELEQTIGKQIQLQVSLRPF